MLNPEYSFSLQTYRVIVLQVENPDTVGLSIAPLRQHLIMQRLGHSTGLFHHMDVSSLDLAFSEVDTANCCWRGRERAGGAGGGEGVID